ncbi:MAG: MFS transporter [Candidatus Rokubacteria bacterium]|nr:MFS transporter [Candidatus Rokubacteria bacterium]
MTPSSESLASPRLWLAFGIMMLVGGIGNSFPVFFPPLLAEFGGSRAATALTVTLMWTGGALFGPLAGYIVGRGDPRWLITVGLLVSAAGLLVGASAPTLNVFTLAVGAGVGIGVGLTGMVTQAAVVADAYVKRRGFATGIAFSGSMAGYVLAIPVHWAITSVGWRGAVAAWSVAVLALIPGVWWAYPRRLGARAAGAALGRAGETRVRGIVVSLPFAMLMIVFTLAPFVGYLATTQHAVYAESIGFSAWEASLMLMIGGVLSTSGRAIAGLSCDRLGASTSGFISYGMTLFGTLCLVGLDLLPSRALAYAYVLFVFLPLGTRATIVSILVSRIAPPAAFGTVFGLLAIGNNLGAGAGPLLSGLIFDLTQSYLAIYATAVGFVTIALIALVVFVRRTSEPLY